MHRRTGIVSMIAISLFLFCGQSVPPVSCNKPIGPSTGEVIGVGVAAAAVITIGTVVLVHTHNSHHTIKGCVVSGPAGIQIQSGSGADMKTYTLAGDPNIKVGDLVKVHGDKVKKVKNSTDNQTFTVEKLNKDYGPCKATP
jgi:hypothetical protein